MKQLALLLSHPEADSVRGVVPSGQNPFKMWKIDPHGVMQPLLDVKALKNLITRRARICRKLTGRQVILMRYGRERSLKKTACLENVDSAAFS